METIAKALLFSGTQTSGAQTTGYPVQIGHLRLTEFFTLLRILNKSKTNGVFPGVHTILTSVLPQTPPESFYVFFTKHCSWLTSVSTDAARPTLSAVSLASSS